MSNSKLQIIVMFCVGICGCRSLVIQPKGNIPQDLKSLASIYETTNGQLIVDFKNRKITIDDCKDFSNLNNVCIQNLSIQQDAGYFQFTNCSNLVLKNIRFAGGNKPIRYTLRISKSSNVTILNCTFRDYISSLKIYECLVLTNSKGVDIRKCLFSGLSAKDIVRGIKITNSSENRDFRVSFNSFKNINSSNDADGIYVFQDVRSRIDLTIERNHFQDIKKRFIKIDASGVTVFKNTGKSPSIETTMYSYVSIYGNNVKVVKNSFLTPRTSVYTGIEIGSRVRNKLSNIYIYKNEFKAINEPKDSLNSQIRVQCHIEGLSVTKNSSVGFYYAVALSKVADYKIGSFTFKDNKLDVNEIFEKPMPLLK